MQRFIHLYRHQETLSYDVARRSLSKISRTLKLALGWRSLLGGSAARTARIYLSYNTLPLTFPHKAVTDNAGRPSFLLQKYTQCVNIWKSNRERKSRQSEAQKSILRGGFLLSNKSHIWVTRCATHAAKPHKYAVFIWLLIRLSGVRIPRVSGLEKPWKINVSEVFYFSKIFERLYQNIQKYTFKWVTLWVTLISPDQFGCFFDIVHVNMGVYVSRDGNIGMAHQLLRCSDINPCLAEVRAVSMAEAVRHEVISQRQRRNESIPIYFTAHRYIHIASQMSAEAVIRAFCVLPAVPVRR